MKVLEAEFSVDTMKDNLVELSDLMRKFVFDNDQKMFERLVYEDDRTFLEPNLFYHYLQKKDKDTSIEIEQILWGYYKDLDWKQKEVMVYADRNGLINLPNVGYLKAKPQTKFAMKFDGAGFQLNEVKAEFIPSLFIDESPIRLCLHEIPLLTKYIDTHFVENTQDTCTSCLSAINRAYAIIKAINPSFQEALDATNRELAVYRAPDKESFASMNYYGVGFIHAESRQSSEIFFIEDMAHQCGHVMFTALTLDPQKFLKVDQDTLIKEFTHVEWEARHVYGVFHGLFTYTTIIDLLSRTIENVTLSDELLAEALGRLGFFMNKFKNDLAKMNDNRILTKNGFDYFDMFKAGYDVIYDQYRHVYREFDYGNQSYVFSNEKFVEQNKEAIPDIVSTAKSL